MRKGLKKITIQSSSCWCPKGTGYEDKLVIKAESVSYELKPEEESEKNPHIKWSYKTNSKHLKSAFKILCQQIPEFEKLEETFAFDINPYVVKFYFEEEILSYKIYSYDEVKYFADMINLLVPNTEDTPNCLPIYLDEEDEKDTIKVDSRDLE